MANPFKLLGGLLVAAIGFISGQAWLAQLGLAVAASALGPDLVTAAQTFQSNSTNPQNALPVVYGKALVGLKMAGFPAKSVDEEFDSLFAVGAVCHGSQNGDGIEEFHEHYLDGIEAVADGARDTAGGGWLVSASPPIASFFDGAFRYARYHGSASQSYAVALNHHFSIEWPTTSRARGVAYVIHRYESDDEVFRSLPRAQVVVSGAKVYDPRSGGSWGFSDNPALCVLDMLTAPIYGRGLPLSKIDTVSFEDAADYCDETVTDPDTTRKRFTCNGVVDTQLSIETRLRQLLSSCNGVIVKQEGTYRIVIRQTQATTGIILTEDDIVGPLRWKQQGITESGNQALVAYVNPSDNYQVDVVTWPQVGSALESTWLLADKGEQVPVAMDLPFTNNQYMALRIANERLREGRDGDVVVALLREQHIQLQVGDIVTIDHTVMGTNAPMDAWVTGMTVGADEDGKGLVQCTFQKYVTNAYVTATLTTLATPPAINPPNFLTITPPTGILASTASLGTGAALPQITWTAPSAAVKFYEHQYGAGASPTSWTPTQNVPAGTTSTAFQIAAPTTAIYVSRVRVRSFYGTPSAWASVTYTLSLGGGGIGQTIGYHDHGDRAGAYTIDWQLGTIHAINVTNAITLSFTGYDAGFILSLHLTGDGSTITLPATDYSPGGVTPTTPGSGEEDTFGYIAYGSASLTNIEGWKVADDAS